MKIFFQFAIVLSGIFNLSSQVNVEMSNNIVKEVVKFKHNAAEAARMNNAFGNSVTSERIKRY